MRIVVHHKKVYDWVPVPDDVIVTKADIAAEKVKPSGSGGYLMKVTKSEPTHTVILLPEEQVIAKIIHEKTRPEGGRTLTRKQAVSFYLSENIMPNHAHRSWVTKIEVENDDGPNEEMVRSMLAPHVEAHADRIHACTAKHTHSSDPSVRCAVCDHVHGVDVMDVPNIDPTELEDHVSKYMETATVDDHVKHLHGHFKVKAGTK